MPPSVPKTLIYTADTSELEDNPDLYDAVYGLVSDGRREKTDRMRSLKDKCLSLGAEYLLIRACRDFGIDYGGTEIVCTEHKKPVFRSCPVSFSLSHSERRAMCVMSVMCAGCDVERVHGINLNIARRFFSESEYASIEACPTDGEREDLFFTLWTLKESFMKCTGLGFSLPLGDFSVSVTPGGVSLSQTVDESSYALFSRDTGDGYKYAWCLKDYTEGEITDEPVIRQQHFSLLG